MARQDSEGSLIEPAKVLEYRTRGMASDGNLCLQVRTRRLLRADGEWHPQNEFGGREAAPSGGNAEANLQSHSLKFTRRPEISYLGLNNEPCSLILKV